MVWLILEWLPSEAGPAPRGGNPDWARPAWAERGLMALTYDRLTQVAVGLGVDMSALLGAHGKTFRPGSIAVARRGEFQLQETPTYSYEILFPELWRKAMTPMTGFVKARSRMEFSRFVRHAGQEFLHILSGQVTVHFEGRDAVTLSAGESMYFDSSMGHVYTSTSEQDARVLVVCLGEKEPLEQGLVADEASQPSQ
jgi:mannose-6-phosphate isomerase-like protein (cupin superfamily)